MKGKLVRDRIPEIILRNDGKKAQTRKLSKKEFEQELFKKLLEEAAEVVAAKNKKEIAGEIADVEEVLAAIIELNALKRSDVAKIQKKKKAERGGFAKRIFLIQ